MAHYSIYIPGASGASDSLLESVGLGALGRRQAWDWCEVPSGPDGGRGVVGTVFTQREDANPILGYAPEKQQWVQNAANPDLDLPKGAFWYGFEPERPPRPLDLAHPTLLGGYDVTLKDGNTWRIPETLQLPLDIGRDPDSGELTKMYPTEYESFCRQAEKYVFVLFQNIMNLEILRKTYPDLEPEEISSEFVLEDVWQYCCQALSINYRVADPILGKGFLDLLDERKLALIVRATIALPDILEVISKKKITSPVSIPVGLGTPPGE